MYMKQLFANFFSAQVLYIRGRQFAVDVLYAKESQVSPESFTMAVMII